jgi:aminoglycoside phosphotransferase (APT) family kinase protein
MTPQDRMTRETIAQLCAVEPFRGARVSDVVALSQRSLCFRLLFADGRRVFVKRAVHVEGGRPASVSHEATVLTALADRGLPAPRPWLTLETEAGTVLVTDDVTGQGSLEQAREQSGGTSVAWAAAVGRTLAAVHAVSPCPLPATNPADTLLRAWTQVTPRAVTLYANGYAELVRLLRGSRLEEPLRDAVAGWVPATAVHGDVKSDNVLCRLSPEQPGSVCLVDWESGGRGDPRWDVGCLIGDYLFTWLSGLDLDAGPDLDDWMAAADPPFSAVQDEMHAATSAYAALRPVTPADRAQWMRYAGFFLLQRLSSSALHSPVLPARSLAYLQVAAQLLRRPSECEELLLCR